MRRALLLALAMLLAALPGLARAQAAPDMEILAPPPKDVGFDQKIGSPLPLDARFQDELGRTVSLGNVWQKGKPVVLQLAYDTCPMLCSLSSQGMVTSLRGINLRAGIDFDVVTLSFDPRDTPERSREKKTTLVSRYGHRESEKGFHFLTGTEEQIRRVTSAVGFRYVWDETAKQYAHPAGIVVLTPDGVIARYLFGIEYAAKDLRLSLVEASQGKLGTTVDQLLLLCYHYDPKTGKYGAAAMGAMRTAGTFTVLSLFGLVFVLARREKKHRKGGGASLEEGS